MSLTLRTVALVIVFCIGVALPAVPPSSQASVARDVDPAAGAPRSVTAVPVVSATRVSWSAPADASTVTAYRVTTPQGFDRTTAVGERSVLVDLESPGVPVTVSVVAVHGDDTSTPATVVGTALAPGTRRPAAPDGRPRSSRGRHGDRR